MPSPGRYCNKITMPTVFLPTSFSYASVYRNYVQACKDKYSKDARILAKSTFINIWKSLMPSLQFIFSKTDLCETSQKEHDYYNTNIINAVEDSKHNPNVNTVEDLVSIVNRFTRINFNVAQRYLNGEGFQYYDFKNYFQAFKKLPHIQKYHHFYFTSQHPVIVFFKDDLQDNYKSFTIRPFSFNADTPLPIIDAKPLS
ncbi:2489_t:CDS:2 [Dentiscutata erythropus]|uniref:2489_t:CDS:1 n=1 Tax=Dentiscutata erythropus TaxID=1348616 RepID=A0A9N9IVJ0_9GLOM|nr:2489_t:CDS:2 [Dentiscutata erythropus]